VSATSSSRFFLPSYWSDPNRGIAYLVQVQIPPQVMSSIRDVEQVPVKRTNRGEVLLRDVAQVQQGTAPAEYDRISRRRLVSLTANIEGSDLGRVSGAIREALLRVGPPPRGVAVDIRGQVAPMREMFGALAGGKPFEGLTMGLVLSVVVIFLLLTAYFQSVKLALVSIAGVPAVLAGVVTALLVTHTTLNIQSFTGAIMAIGVAVANAILLITFAERERRTGIGTARDAASAAIEGGRRRLRPILMTSGAMLAGMIPMALALTEGGEQTAPLGRAVIGGLAAATLTTLLVLPAVFVVVQARSRTYSPSLDPSDPEGRYYSPQSGSGPGFPADRGDGL
jgi:multidrug efflux pump subunit AcrB